VVVLLRNNDTFVRITNKEVYAELLALREENRHRHEEIRSRLDLTNGKVKRSLWVASTAMSLCVILIGLLFTHIGK
jgi:hypothetical protein